MVENFPIYKMKIVSINNFFESEKILFVSRSINLDSKENIVELIRVFIRKNPPSVKLETDLKNRAQNGRKSIWPWWISGCDKRGSMSGDEHSRASRRVNRFALGGGVGGTSTGTIAWANMTHFPI